MPKKISIASYLQEGYPSSLEKGTLSVGFSKDLLFHKEVLESPDNKSLIEEAIKAVLGKELKVAFVLTEPVNMPRGQNGNAGLGMAGDATEEEGDAKKEVDPIVKKALEIFGGDSIRDLPQSGAGRQR